MYAGYFPMGLSLDRIFGDMRAVPFNENVLPKFLYENAKKLLKL
jgi:predicted TIM-barrel fold metal-dependent hydrolase